MNAIKHSLGIDVGTTSLKACAFDENANCVKTVVKDYTLETKGDYVEFPAEDYWTLTKNA